MQIAWLGRWSYTHMVSKEICSHLEYIPQDSNEKTIDFVRYWWVWIVPIMNTYWWSVRKEIGEIIRWMDNIHMKWIYYLPIEHVLAWIGELTDIREVHAHNQALIQCSDGLQKIWASTENLINEYNFIKEKPNTTKCIIEINDWIWVLEKITAIFEWKKINIRHIHSFPSWKWKYRFYMSYDNTFTSVSQIDKELEKIWWQMIFEQKKQIGNSEIKLIPRNTNVDWILEAKENPNIWVICSEETALDNWLQVLNRELSPKDNITSFVVLANNQTKIHLSNFTWIVQDRVIWLLTLPNSVWILRQALSIIKNTWLSLNFILSLNDWEWGARISLVMKKWVGWEILEVRKNIQLLWGDFKTLG